MELPFTFLWPNYINIYVQYFSYLFFSSSMPSLNNPLLEVAQLLPYLDSLQMLPSAVCSQMNLSKTKPSDQPLSSSDRHPLTAKWKSCSGCLTSQLKSSTIWAQTNNSFNFIFYCFPIPWCVDRPIYLFSCAGS